MNAGLFPSLAQFLGAYFHEDWQEEFRTEAAAVAAYVEQASPSALQCTHAELGRLWEETQGSDAIERLLADAGCAYNPRPKYRTARAWIRSLTQRIARGIPAPRKIG